MTSRNPGDLTHVAKILRNAIAGCRPVNDTGMLRIWEIWEPSVGEMIAGNARPAAFKGDVLVVHVNSSVWVQHLGFVKQEIIRKLNDALGAQIVREIRFKIGLLDGMKTGRLNSSR